MQIEKPKSSIPPVVLFLALIIGVFIASLPFLAKQARSKESRVQVAQPASKEEPRLDPQVINSANHGAKNLVDADIQSSLLLDDQPALEVPVFAAPKSGDVVSTQVVANASIEKSTPENSLKSTSKESPSALLTSFYGDVKVIGPRGEEKKEKNKQILKGETIEVGAAGEAIIELEELYILRLKPNTKLTQLEPLKGEVFSGKELVTYRFKLEQGAMLGTTKFRGDKINMLDLIVSDKTYHIKNSTFRVQLTDASPWIGVLRGSINAEVESHLAQKPIVIHALEKVGIADAPSTAPLKVSEAEWGLLRETYEMNMKSAAEKALQLDLSKRAGNFFESVFDHGTFYTENVGYTVRDFYEDKASGDVYLEAEYDVFPSNSFVGLYVLTRDLDSRNFSGLRFDVRRKPDEGYPDRFYLEIKSKGQIIHRFEITGVKPEWQSRQIDFFNPVSTPITEVTLVFLNENIGQAKKGFIQMRNVELIPLSNEQKNRRAEYDKNPVPASMSAAIKRSPLSSKQSIVTLPMQKAKTTSSSQGDGQAATFQPSSKKIANEVPKLVSLDDLGS